MRDLAVLTFQSETGAQRVWWTVCELPRQELIALDAATVVRRQDGKPKVIQATSLVGFALAIGTVISALGGHFTDIGIDDAFIREVGRKIQPGTSALLLLVRRATMDRVLDTLEPYTPEVLRASLSIDAEAKLRAAFGDHDEEVRTPAATAEAMLAAPALALS
jgi:uncharacterized membrane protein